jgi:hypothetical protein
MWRCIRDVEFRCEGAVAVWGLWWATLYSVFFIIQMEVLFVRWEFSLSFWIFCILAQLNERWFWQQIYFVYCINKSTHTTLSHCTIHSLDPLALHNPLTRPSRTSQSTHSTLSHCTIYSLDPHALHNPLTRPSRTAQSTHTTLSHCTIHSLDPLALHKPLTRHTRNAH